MKRTELYYQMLLIRRFEERLFELFENGELDGTIHTSLGQESIAVAILNHLNKNDIVISNHRCHGHYLARTNDVVGLLAEIMGKKEGVCGGRGGSQHIHKDNFFSNGVQGNMIPVAAGMSYAEKLNKTDAILVIFIGDGTFGQGVLYETLNIISLWSLPIIVVVENNQYAQSTKLEMNFSGSFSGRAKAFNISVGEIETNDVEKLYQRFKPIVNRVRKTKSPHVEIVHTFRLGPHSKGDDDRPTEEIDMWAKKDPLIITENHLEKHEIKKIESAVKNQISKAEQKTRAMSF
jgi:TPP-dependent pyruvate/acetoin dehydrogenase alpha subunit